jgi:uncharacterized membrane protein YobD (UPF0266 family)
MEAINIFHCVAWALSPKIIVAMFNSFSNLEVICYARLHKSSLSCSGVLFLALNNP